MTRRFEYAEELAGKRFAFFGRFAHWPAVFGDASPAAHVTGRGALVEPAVDTGLDYLVVGDGPQKGRADAVRAAERLRNGGERPATLDEHGFLHLIRPVLEGRTFVCAGGFTRGGLNLEGGPAGLLASHGAEVREQPDEGVDFVVVGDRRARGKAATLRKTEKLQQAGASIVVLSEAELLEVVGCLHGGEDAGDFRTFAARLRRIFNERKVDRALEMLQAQALELYTDVRKDSVGGIVKGQSGTNYLCWLDDAGRFSCVEPDMCSCMGLQGAMCKHIMALIIGLTRAGELEPARAEALVLAAARKRPGDIGRRGAELLLRYKGAMSGEVDWRPTHTVPEDYYAL